MDILSILLFFIYSALILLILVYISPVLAGSFMIIVPIILNYILHEITINFLSIAQFSSSEGFVQIQNIHIMLLIWAGFISIIAYAEFLYWYILREPKIQSELPPKKNRIIDFLSKYITILKGEKVKKS